MILESAQEEVKSGKIQSIESKIHGFVVNWKISYIKVDQVEFLSSWALEQ